MNPQTHTYSTVAPWPGQDDGDTGRRQRGLAIAAISRIERNRLGWKIPSQSSNGLYIVNLEGEPFCTCPDFESRQRPASISTLASTLSNGRFRRMAPLPILSPSKLLTLGLPTTRPKPMNKSVSLSYSKLCAKVSLLRRRVRVAHACRSPMWYSP